MGVGVGVAVCCVRCSSQVKAPMMGRISKLIAAVGKAVKKGEVLVVRGLSDSRPK